MEEYVGKENMSRLWVMGSIGVCGQGFNPLLFLGRFVEMWVGLFASAFTFYSVASSFSGPMMQLV